MNETKINGLKEINIFELIPYVCLNLFGTVSGTLGNLMILGAIIFTKKLQDSTGIVIFNLALSDLFISTLSNPAAIIGVLVGESFFSKMPFTCKLIAMVCRITCATAFLNIVLLSIIRFFYVCYKNIYMKYFTIKMTCFICFLTWIVGFFSDFPNQLVENGHHFDEMVRMCIFDHKIIRPATYFFSIALMIAPCICIGFFYSKIFIVTLNAKLNLNDKKKLKQLKKSLNVSKGLFMSFIIFNLCVFPYAIVMMTDFESRFPHSVHMFLFLLARLNSSLNPILYGLTNSKFKKGFKNLYCKLCCKTSVDCDGSSYRLAITKKNLTQKQ